MTVCSLVFDSFVCICDLSLTDFGCALAASGCHFIVFPDINEKHKKKSIVCCFEKRFQQLKIQCDPGLNCIYYYIMDRNLIFLD